MVDEKTYNRDYWKKNKEKLLNKKKKRYLEDPVYREKMKVRAKEQKKRLYDLETEDMLGGRSGMRGCIAPKKHKVELPSGRTVVVEMMTIGQLGKALGRVPQTLRGWERQGILPRAIYRDNNDNRLYTEFQVNKLKELLLHVREVDGAIMVKNRINSTVFPKLANQLWKDYPYGIDENEIGEVNEEKDSL